MSRHILNLVLAARKIRIATLYDGLSAVYQANKGGVGIPLA